VGISNQKSSSQNILSGINALTAVNSPFPSNPSDPKDRVFGLYELKPRTPAPLFVYPYAASTKELKRMEAFYDCTGATNGTLQMPVTLFIKDGKLVKRVSELVG
jgi:hypothetical protein